MELNWCYSTTALNLRLHSIIFNKYRKNLIERENSTHPVFDLDFFNKTIPETNYNHCTNNNLILLRKNPEE